MQEIKVKGFEQVLEVEEKSLGISAFLAIHSTQRGPALGGMRFYPYSDKNDALRDALRLAEGMTHKAALANLPLGGGKLVVMGSLEKKNPAALEFLARFVGEQRGRYITAEDLGTTLEDALFMKTFTPHVVGLPLSLGGGGDPSIFTAFGVLRCMEAVGKHLWDDPSLEGKHVAIQGLGKVGFALARFLFWKGARLSVADVCPQRTLEAQLSFGADIVSTEDILHTKADILAPCALGGVLNPATIPYLQAQAVVGGANNLFDKGADELWLKERKITYVPDYLANSGGLINASCELLKEGYNPKIARQRTSNLFSITEELLKKAEETGKTASYWAGQKVLSALNSLNPIDVDTYALSH